jgi:hypothetical protein
MVTMSDDPTVQPAPQTVRIRGGHRVADHVATAMLLIAHLGLYCASFMMLGLMVMSTDACAYQKCGDEAWLWRAMHLAGWGGAALLAVDVTVTLWRLVRQRVAWFIPLLGCIAQLALALGCFGMEMKAGPVK